METITNLLSTRDFANVIWTSLMIACVIMSRKYSVELKNLLQAALNKRLLFIYVLLLCYIASFICLLYSFNLWSCIFLYDATIWYFYTALSIIFSLANVSDNKQFIALLKTEFSALIIFEFILGLYSYAWWLELIAVPIVAILYMLSCIPGNKHLAKISTCIISIIVLFEFAYSILLFWHSNSLVFIIRESQKFILPIIYTIITIPLFYYLTIHFCYLRLFTALDLIGRHNTKKQIRTIKLLCVAHCRGSLLKIKQVYRVISLLGSTSTRREAATHIKNATRKPKIKQNTIFEQSIALFNTPNKCCKRLSRIGIGEISDWHQAIGDTYYCAYTNKHNTANNENYPVDLYLYGSEAVVTTLCLQMHILSKEFETSALLFREKLIQEITKLLPIPNFASDDVEMNYRRYENSEYIIESKREKVLKGEVLHWEVKSKRKL